MYIYKNIYLLVVVLFAFIERRTEKDALFNHYYCYEVKMYANNVNVDVNEYKIHAHLLNQKNECEKKTG